MAPNALLHLRHSPEGRTELTKLIVARCVERGRYWLNRNARKGWWRNCLNGGSSRVHTSYGNEGILGLAFEYDVRFADNSGYINEGKVMRHFKLWMFTRQTDRLGFTAGPMFSGYVPFKRKYPDIIITCSVLDRAWANFLENPPTELRMTYRHPLAFEKRFAELDFSPPHDNVFARLLAGARLLVSH